MKTRNCMLRQCLMLLAIFVCSVGASDEIESNIEIPLYHKQLAQGVLLGNFSQLDPAKKPSENFDLLDWSLTLPTDLNSDKKADIVYEAWLMNSSLNRYFTPQKMAVWCLPALMKVPKPQAILNMPERNYAKCSGVVIPR